MNLLGETIGIISIKGGVGKTTTTVTLAAALAKEFGKRVLAIDANFSAPNLGLHLGIVNPETTLHEVLAGKKDITKAIINTEHGFDIIPAALESKLQMDYLDLKKHIQKIKNHYDIILLDSSPNLNKEILATMVSSDRLLVVSTPDYPTISCTMRAVKVAQQKGTPIAGIILNKVHKKNFELSIQEIEKQSNNSVLAVLSHDLSMLEALSLTRTPHSFDDRSDPVIEMNKLAGSLIGETYQDPRILGSLRSRFDRNKKISELNRKLFMNDEYGR